MLHELFNHVEVGFDGDAAALIRHFFHYQTPQYIGSKLFLMLLLIVVCNSELPLRGTPRSDTLFVYGVEANRHCPAFESLRY